EIRAALAAGGAAPPPHDVAEEIVENIGHGGGEALAHAEPAAAATVESGMAETIVGGALLRVRKGLVGLVHFLEAEFGCLIAWVAVGMALHRRLAEGGLQLRVGRAA